MVITGRCCFEKVEKRRRRRRKGGNSKKGEVHLEAHLNPIAPLCWFLSWVELRSSGNLSIYGEKGGVGLH